MSDPRRRRAESPATARESSSSSSSKKELPPLYSVSLSDLVFSTSSLVPALVIHQRDGYGGAAAFKELVVCLGLFLVGFPALLGVPRFALPRLRPVARLHEFAACVGSAVGVPLLGVAFFYARPESHPPHLGAGAVLLVVGLLVSFALVRWWLPAVRDETYNGAMAGLGVLLILARSCAEMAEHLLGPNPPQGATDVLLSTGFAGLVVVALYVLSGVVGVEGVAVLPGGVLAYRVNVFHYLLFFANSVLFLALHTMLFSTSFEARQFFRRR